MNNALPVGPMLFTAVIFVTYFFGTCSSRDLRSARTNLLFDHRQGNGVRIPETDDHLRTLMANLDQLQRYQSNVQSTKTGMLIIII